jgi:hypothetical protein
MISGRMLFSISLILIIFRGYGVDGVSLKCSACEAVAVRISKQWRVSIDAFNKDDSFSSTFYVPTHDI